MPSTINFDSEPMANELLGLIDYYEIVFRDKELIRKESEFRNHRLCLILELIDAVEIPEDLMTELKSAIIDAWRLNVPGSNREKRSTEISMVLRSLEQLRVDIKSAIEHPDLRFRVQLNVDVLKSVSLKRTDFELKKGQKVQDLLDLTMKHLESAIQGYEVDLATA